MFLTPASRSRYRPRAYDQAPYQIKATVSGNNLFIVVAPDQGRVPLIGFRDSAASSGATYFRQIPNAQFVINSGNTMGASSNVAFRLWVLGFDNGSGISVGAINCVVGGASPTQVFGLDESSVQSPAGGNGGSTAAAFFCAQALINRPFRILGYLEWSSGLATAGTWSANPTTVQFFGAGIKKPGDRVKLVRTPTGTVATGTTTIPFDNTIPQNTEGDQYMSQAITPASAANVLKVSSQGFFAGNNAPSNNIMALFQDTTANALAAIDAQTINGTELPMQLEVYVTANTTSSTTFKIRSGLSGVGTTTFNGRSGSQLWGGVANSYIQVEEIMG